MSMDRIDVTSGTSYSKAVVVSGPGRTVYVSGCIARGNSLAEQAHGCIDQIEAARG